jgi:uncharacterized protein (PEP-CTERM system associated)
MAVTADKGRIRESYLRRDRRAPLAGAFSVFAALTFAAPAAALDWRLTPSVDASVTYTDNAGTGDGSDEALIFRLGPDVSLQTYGSRRVQASLQYGASAVSRFGDDNSESLSHRLNAVAKSELVDDFLYLDASARVSHELISLFGAPADSDLNDSNRALVGAYTVSPYISKRLGSFATAQARYTASGSVFGDNVASNANANGFSAGLSSGSRFNDVSWRLNYSIRDSRSDTENTTLERATLQMGYAVTRKFRVIGTYGQDRNEYLSTSDTDGSSYSIGFGWSPSRRTSMEASVGERYFGRTYNLTGRHQARTTSWSVSYIEDVSDITQQFLSEVNRFFWICPSGSENVIETDDLTPPEEGCDGPVSATQLAAYYVGQGFSVADLLAADLLDIGIANGIYVIKRFNAGVSWNLGRLVLGMSAFDTRRVYQNLASAQDQRLGVTWSASYRLTPHTRANGSLTLGQTQTDALLNGGTERQDENLNISLGVSHRFAEDLSGALAFRHTQRDSDVVGGNYDSNSLTASVNMHF